VAAVNAVDSIMICKKINCPFGYPDRLGASSLSEGGSGGLPPGLPGPAGGLPGSGAARLRAAPGLPGGEAGDPAVTGLKKYYGIDMST